jgi:cytochrome c
MSRRSLLLLLPLIVACHREPVQQNAQSSGNAERGKQLVTQYGCNVCHIAPGVPGPQGMLGPTFAGVASRATLSRGTVPNTPDNIARFIQSPASMNPASAMPPLNVTPADAQDLASSLSA